MGVTRRPNLSRAPLEKLEASYRLGGAEAMRAYAGAAWICEKHLGRYSVPSAPRYDGVGAEVLAYLQQEGPQPDRFSPQSTASWVYRLTEYRGPVGAPVSVGRVRIVPMCLECARQWCHDTQRDTPVAQRCACEACGAEGWWSPYGAVLLGELGRGRLFLPAKVLAGPPWPVGENGRPLIGVLCEECAAS